MPVHHTAGHRHPQRKSRHHGGKHCSAGVQVSGTCVRVGEKFVTMHSEGTRRTSVVGVKGSLNVCFFLDWQNDNSY